MAELRRVDTADPLIWYKELVRYALDSGSAPGFYSHRDDLAQAILTENQDQKLAALDEEALVYILDLDWLDPELTQDDNNQPLQNWWWHLGEIRAKTYPAKLLPDHLQTVYLDAKDT